MVYREVLIFWLPALLVGLIVGSVSANANAANDSAKISEQTPSKPRLIVLTDITSIKAGVREPDDAQSMIRLMLYSNEFDIEGLIASSSLGRKLVVRPQNIREIVNAYEKCRPNLVLNDEGYPTAGRLLQVIKSGQPQAGKGMPVFESIGKGKDTQASKWIIRAVDKPDKRPLWITIWGGSADLAQALWKVRQTRSPQEVARFVGKIRVAASADQDSTGPWIKSQFPDLFYATRGKGARGMYRGGDQSLVSSAWVQKNIKGHGALGNIYPDYRGGDIWTNQLGQVKGIKGGDSASFMGLIPNGLNVPGHLTWENWGGRLKQDTDNSHHYHEAIDAVGEYRTDISPYLAAVYRWRPAFQSAFAARFNWCVKPYNQVNHAPVSDDGIEVIQKKIAVGERVKLPAGDWSDPDGNNLTYHWQVLKEESSYSKSSSLLDRGAHFINGFVRHPVQTVQRLTGSSTFKVGPAYFKELPIENESSRLAEFIAPAVNHPQSIHILLTVTDDGHPALSSYQRSNFTVYP